MDQFRAISFSYKTIGLEKVGQFHLEDEIRSERLHALKQAAGLEELMYLSTCNRVEFYFLLQDEMELHIEDFFKAFQPDWEERQLDWAVEEAAVYEGPDAVRHLFNVASSLESLVVGEREIITQVRQSYEDCLEMGLTGDFIRMAMKRTIETAKQVYTETNIARNPVSVVTLAARKLRYLNVAEEAKFLVVGAGQTIQHLTRYLRKRGFKNYTVFNRTIENAQKLANTLKCEAFPLSELPDYKEHFDVILTCTGSRDPVITRGIYHDWMKIKQEKKIIVDLAIPNDVAPEVIDDYPIHYISVNKLQEQAAENLKVRKRELGSCRAIVESQVADFGAVYRERRVELAMRVIPQQVKEIKNVALTEVFAKDLDQLDDASKEVLTKVLTYMEKKYISGPMRMAKSIMLDTKIE